MRKAGAVILVLFLVIGLFATPSFAAAGDYIFSEIESNDTMSSADRIYNNYTVSGKISSKNDIDYFKFTLSTTTNVALLCASPQSVIMIGIADSGGNIIDAAIPYYDDGYYWNTYYGTLPAGTYYIILLEDQDYSYTNVGYVFYFDYGMESHIHELYESIVYPTCTEPGYSVYTCSCGYSYISNYKSETGHSYGSWITETEATCSVAGTRVRTCSKCYCYETESIPQLSHIAGDWIVEKEATCASYGAKYRNCTLCDVKVDEMRILPYEHRFEGWKTILQPTATSMGQQENRCTGCDYVEYQVICAVPELKSVTNDASGVKLSWNKASGADKYEIYRKTGSGKYSKIATVKGNSKVTYTDKSSKSGKKYSYYVKAVNDVCLSSNSSSKSIVFLEDTTLKTPSSTKAGIKLKWSKITGAEGYKVYRKTGSGSYSCIATVKGSTKVAYTDKSAKKGKTYTYKIKVYKSKTYSAYSNAKKIKDRY